LSLNAYAWTKEHNIKRCSECAHTDNRIQMHTSVPTYQRAHRTIIHPPLRTIPLIASPPPLPSARPAGRNVRQVE
jgi:hypothetical protein